MSGILICWAVSLALPQGSRLPVPDRDARKDAEEVLKQAFKADYASRDLDTKRALARKLFKEGEAAEGDPVARYVFFSEAGTLAAEAGDPQLAARAVDLLARHYTIDLIRMKSAVLAESRRPAQRTRPGAVALARAYLVYLNQILAQDAFDRSDREGRAAESAALSSKDSTVLEDVRALRKELAAVKREHRRAESAIETLGKNPEDPDSNLTAGIYYCLAKGQWARGLPHLARGSDATLKSLAARDIAAPEDAIGRVEVGDGWWDLAENERDTLRKSRLHDRARFWYESAMPALTRLNRLRIEPRLKEMEESPFRTRGRQGGILNLLSWIDLKASAPPGTGAWTFEGGSLLTPGVQGNTFARLMIPCVPPEEYDIVATLERREGAGHFTFGLIAQEKKFHVIIDYQNARTTTVSYFNRLWGAGLQRTLPNEKIYHAGPVLTNGKPSRVVCAVRRNRLSVTIDGKMLVDYKDPPYDTATVYPGFSVPDETTLSLAVGGPFLVRGLALRPVTGLPRRAR